MPGGRLLIKGGGFSNKGDEAMMRTTQREMARRIPGLTFVIRVPSRQGDLAHLSGFSAVMIESSRLKKALTFFRWAASSANRCRALLINRHAAMEMSEVGEVDGVLDISGFGYSDEWGTGFTSRGLAWARYCSARRAPLICLPQAWGPFRKAAVAAHTSEICRRSRLVFARDGVSARYLDALLQGSGVTVEDAPDIAFKFRGAPPQVGGGILSGAGVQLGQRPIVGLTPNTRIYDRTRGEGQMNEYVAFMARVVRHCIQHWGAQVVLIPHEISMADRPKRDDRFLCSLIELASAPSGRCISLSSCQTSEQTKSIIGHLDILIGSRFHSLVFALAAALPVVAVGWAHKYEQLMGLFGLEGHAVEHRHLDFEVARKLLDRVWANRGQTSAQVSRALPAIEQRVDRVFDKVALELEQTWASKEP